MPARNGAGAASIESDPRLVEVLLGERDEEQVKPHPRSRQLKSQCSVAAQRFAQDLTRRAAARVFFDDAIQFVSEER